MIHCSSTVEIARPPAVVFAFVERGMVGGVSLHSRTISSKTMREAVLYLTGL